jgi:hypothetical protein
LLQWGEEESALHGGDSLGVCAVSGYDRGSALRLASVLNFKFDTAAACGFEVLFDAHSLKAPNAETESASGDLLTRVGFSDW